MNDAGAMGVAPASKNGHVERVQAEAFSRTGSFQPGRTKWQV